MEVDTSTEETLLTPEKYLEEGEKALEDALEETNNAQEIVETSDLEPTDILESETHVDENDKSTESLESVLQLLDPPSQPEIKTGDEATDSVAPSTENIETIEPENFSTMDTEESNIMDTCAILESSHEMDTSAEQFTSNSMDTSIPKIVDDTQPPITEPTVTESSVADDSDTSIQKIVDDNTEPSVTEPTVTEPSVADDSMLNIVDDMHLSLHPSTVEPTVTESSVTDDLETVITDSLTVTESETSTSVVSKPVETTEATLTNNAAVITTVTTAAVTPTVTTVAVTYTTDTITLFKPPSEIDLTKDVSVDTATITAAKDYIKQLDIFVCGSCHESFHFIEEFQQHKTGTKCTGVSKVNISDTEGKPQIWGFSLWKTKQLKDLKMEVPPWNIYQKWCQLLPVEKEAWISAGQNMQYCSKIGNAKVTGFIQSKDPLALDNGELYPNKKLFDSNKAYRTTKEQVPTERKLANIEKIVGKRFNPRRKTWEYQVKWDDLDSSCNTWEATANLAYCKKMIEQFEENLKKLKADAKRNGTTPKGRGRPKLPPGSPRPYVAISPKPSPALSQSFSESGRPQRASKQKALNQVKSWCGNISDADEGGIKRSYEDDDSDDSFEKKMRMEDYSDSDEEKPKYTMKKTPRPISTVATITTNSPTVNAHTVTTFINNGVGQKIPPNVLIPDANGVVRINQKQLPSLSTGVYIMSKTAGIIKLDSTTSKVATSGGQTIVKVAPKIGQTQIKIVKKGEPAKTATMQINKSPTAQKVYTTSKPVISKVKKVGDVGEKTPQKTTVRKQVVKSTEKVVVVASKEPEPDSDDGLPELEFPTDMPLPAPESPPGDFVLDPTTGKIFGQDYPDPPVNVKVEETNSLENIVKLAAADITEDDLHADPPTDPIAIPEIKQIKTEQLNIKAEADEKTNSILNKALTNSNIIQKTNQAVRPKPPHQRILNQSVATRPQMNVTTVVRPVNRHSPQKNYSPRPRFNISATTAPSPQNPRQVYSHQQQRHMKPKQQVTAVYKSINRTQQPQSRLVQQQHSNANVNVYKTTLKKQPVQSKPKQVINMPSLISEEDPPVVSIPSAEPSPTETPTETTPAPSAAASEAADQTITLPETDTPIFITGDDGTVYQVAGQNEQGQTILITQGSDGQQQCLLVTNEAQEEGETSVVEEEEEEEESAAPSATEVPPALTEPLSIKADADSSSTNPDQVVAQVVRAEPPSPGGTHKVVVMLPDGNLMVTEVSPEEYASLELE